MFIYRVCTYIVVCRRRMYWYTYITYTCTKSRILILHIIYKLYMMLHNMIIALIYIV